MGGEKILCHKLSNGVIIPVVSLGTWNLAHDHPHTPQAVETALDCGYRAIDTAWIYKNEGVIGPLVKAFKPSERKNVPTAEPHQGSNTIVVSAEEFKKSFATPHGAVQDDREIFVTSKVWVTFFSAEGVPKQVDEHLKNFSRSSTDLMLLHWPGVHTGFGSEHTVEEMKADQWPVRQATWRAMEDQYHAGRIRAIGVSNYLLKHLKPLLAWIDERKAAGDSKALYPMVNQFELSVFLHPAKELQELCDKYNILITGYSSLGGQNTVAKNLEDPALKNIASHYPNISTSTVMLRWLVERGYTILPRSSNADRIKANLHDVVYKFAFTEQDLAALNGMDRQARNLPSPDDIN